MLYSSHQWIDYQQTLSISFCLANFLSKSWVLKCIVYGWIIHSSVGRNSLHRPTQGGYRVARWLVGYLVPACACETKVEGSSPKPQ